MIVKNAIYILLILVNLLSCSPMQDKDRQANINDFGKSLDAKTDQELYKIANELYDSDINDKAVIAFQKCIERNYNLDTSYYKQGVSYIGLGQSKIGVEKLEQALKINPKYYKACFNIGVACYDNQEYHKSIDFYQKAVSLEPNDDRSYYGIAASQFVLGHFKDSEANCQMALKLNPENENAMALLKSIKNRM
jgi:tetratricopeptide (TPR) repeat protein